MIMIIHLYMYGMIIYLAQYLDLYLAAEELH